MSTYLGGSFGPMFAWMGAVVAAVLGMIALPPVQRWLTKHCPPPKPQPTPVVDAESEAFEALLGLVALVGFACVLAGVVWCQLKG